MRISGGTLAETAPATGPRGVAFTAAASTLKAGKVAVNVAASESGLAIVFNDIATQLRVDEVLRSIGYSNGSDAPLSSVALSWTLRDGNGAYALEASDTSTVLIQEVDDPLTGTVVLSGSATQGKALGLGSVLTDKDGLASVGSQ